MTGPTGVTGVTGNSGATGVTGPTGRTGMTIGIVFVPASFVELVSVRHTFLLLAYILHFTLIVTEFRCTCNYGQH